MKLTEARLRSIIRHQIQLVENRQSFSEEVAEMIYQGHGG